ncbi:unnamed protein product [Blepharisma stoltei]|uniref:Reverse transcriptase n=1 Tax=Blepharisma stoltei TaxID=1481888 RepID=A0AAU9J0N3_9CILI|nr:unnamed protein product [Blepharisma stoltei]
MKVWRVQVKEFKREVERQKKLRWQERKAEQAAMDMKSCWSSMQKLKRSMRAKPPRFSRLETEALVSWWEAQYSSDDSGPLPSLREWNPPERAEVETAIKSLGNGKAIGNDGVPAELIKYLIKL